MKDGGMIPENKFALIPYETVGNKGVLEAVRISCAELMTEPILGRETGSRIKIDGFIIARNSEDFHMGDNEKMKEGSEYELLLSNSIKGSIF